MKKLFTVHALKNLLLIHDETSPFGPAKQG